MKQITVTISVDEDAVLNESGQSNLEDAISQELGWLHDSGMFVDSWSFQEPAKAQENGLKSNPSKMSCLCEEVEDGDGIREFSILAVSAEKDLLRKLLGSYVAQDTYGLVSKNGVDDFSQDHFQSTFQDGFISYYIADLTELSREELQTILSVGENQPVTKYAVYNCGDFYGFLSAEEYNALKESGKLPESDMLDYEPIFDGIVYPTLGESINAQIEKFGYQYHDDRRTKLSLAEQISSASAKAVSSADNKILSRTADLSAERE